VRLAGTTPPLSATAGLCGSTAEQPAQQIAEPSSSGFTRVHGIAGNRGSIAGNRGRRPIRGARIGVLIATENIAETAAAFKGLVCEDPQERLPP